MIKKLLSILSIIFVTSSFGQSVCSPDFYGVEDTIRCNDSTMIIFNNPGGVESFDCGPNNDQPCNPEWGTNPGTDFSKPHITQPSPDGNGYLWMGNAISSQPSPGGNNTPRTVTSPPMNTSCGGQICFDFIYAPSGGSAPLEQPDLYNEGISLQYQVAGSTTWTDIKYWAPNGDTLPANPGISSPGIFGPGPFETWQDDECVNIPLVAQGPVVRFRFAQDNPAPGEFSDSGFCCDHWGIDDIVTSINADQMDGYLTGAYDINGAPLPYAPRTFSTQPDTMVVAPLESTMYTFIVTNVPYTGTYIGFDTVWVYLEETKAGAVNQLACNTVGTELFVEGVMPNSPITWSPDMFIDSINSHTPFVVPPTDMYYTVTSQCGVDSILVDVVPIFTPLLSATQDSICVGDITTITANSDQATNTYTYQWSPATVAFDTAMTTDAFPTTNTTYIVEMVSDSGCVRQDSITIFVGAVPKTINYAGEMRMCLGDSTQITVLPVQPTFFDDFELGANPSIWDSTYNASANADCGTAFAGSVNALHFDGAGARGVQTFPLDASLGGTISFHLIYGSTFGGGPCDDVAFNAEMELQYSIDGGATWSTIRLFESNEHDNWGLQTDTVPLAAQTTATIFRLHQDFSNGQDQDNWAIDDFLMELNCSGTNCVQYNYSWTPTTFVSDANVANPFFYPNTSTWYSVAISPEGFNCNAAADSIFVEVDEYPINITPGDTFLCEQTPILLELNNSDLDGACVGGGGQFTLEMNDTFGDGWNGDFIDVIADGTSVGNYTIPGGSANTEVFTVPNGALIEFILVDGPGFSYPSEISFNLLDANGATLFTESSSTPNLAYGSTFFSIVTGCVDTMFWTPNNGTLTSTTSTSPVATPQVSTNYVANVINTNGCLFQDSISIEIYESNITLTDHLDACFGDSIQLEATGADTYAWTSSNNTSTLSDTSIANPMSGTNTTVWYYVDFETQGCVEEDSVRVTILNLAPPTINNGVNPVIFCEGESADLYTASLNGYTYSWSGPETGTGNSINVSTPGSYSVEYFDGNCTNQRSVEVLDRPIPVLNFDAIEKNLCCEDDELVIDFASMVSNQNLSEIDGIYWNGMEVTGNSYTYNSEGANFTQLDAIKVISVYGCEGEAELAIQTNCINPSLSNSIPDTVYFENPTVFDLNITEGDAENITYAWSTDEPGANTIEDPTVQDAVFNGVTEGGIYTATVIATSTYGTKTCNEDAIGTGSVNYEVVAIPDPVYPDAFTPNGDGLNDTYRPVINYLLTMTEMRVYNRWGDLVYNMSTAENKNGWDGKFQGQDQGQGLYTYFIKVVHPDGSDYLQEGQVSLIR